MLFPAFLYVLDLTSIRLEIRGRDADWITALNLWHIGFRLGEKLGTRLRELALWARGGEGAESRNLGPVVLHDAINGATRSGHPRKQRTLPTRRGPKLPPQNTFTLLLCDL